MAQEIVQGHWFGPVDQLLRQATADGRKRCVLDVGAGTGTWLREMAGLFPEVYFTGMDVIPIPPPPRTGPSQSLAPTFLTDDNGPDSDSGSGSASGSDDGMEQDSEGEGEGEGDINENSGLDNRAWNEGDNVRFITADINDGLGEIPRFDLIQCRYVMTLAVSEVMICTGKLKPSSSRSRSMKRLSRAWSKPSIQGVSFYLPSLAHRTLARTDNPSHRCRARASSSQQSKPQ